MRDNGDFITDMRKQIMNSQERRASFVRQKLTFVISFLGVGSISFVIANVDIKAWILLYLAPIVALVFDLYIIGESFTIKRLGVFIRECPKSPSEERIWEKCVSKHRDLLPKLGFMASSTMVLIAAMIVLWISKKVNLFYVVWVIIIVSTLLILWQIDKQTYKKLKAFEDSISKERKCSSENKQ
jgi:hypothetical protein